MEKLGMDKKAQTCFDKVAESAAVAVHRDEVMEERFIDFNDSGSDRDWEEYEKEIDAQVDAVFSASEKMKDFAEEYGMSEKFDLDGGGSGDGNTAENFNSGQLIESMEQLNEAIMKIRKERNLFPWGRFLLVFAVSMLVMHYMNPAMWEIKKNK